MKVNERLLEDEDDDDIITLYYCDLRIPKELLLLHIHCMHVYNSICSFLWLSSLDFFVFWVGKQIQNSETNTLFYGCLSSAVYNQQNLLQL